MTRRSNPQSVPAISFPYFSINCCMAFSCVGDLELQRHGTTKENAALPPQSFAAKPHCATLITCEHRLPIPPKIVEKFNIEIVHTIQEPSCSCQWDAVSHFCWSLACRSALRFATRPMSTSR